MRRGRGAADRSAHAVGLHKVPLLKQCVWGQVHSGIWESYEVGLVLMSDEQQLGLYRTLRKTTPPPPGPIFKFLRDEHDYNTVPKDTYSYSYSYCIDEVFQQRPSRNCHPRCYCCGEIER